MCIYLLYIYIYIYGEFCDVYHIAGTIDGIWILQIGKKLHLTDFWFDKMICHPNVYTGYNEVKYWRITEISSNRQIKSLVNNNCYTLFNSGCTLVCVCVYIYIYIYVQKHKGFTSCVVESHPIYYNAYVHMCMLFRRLQYIWRKALRTKSCGIIRPTARVIGHTRWSIIRCITFPS